MKRILCIVQRHMFSDAEINGIEKGFRNLYQKHYSHEKLNVLWMVMPEGYAFSERKRSNAAVIVVEVAEDITKEEREKMMNLYSQFLLQNYDISPLDSVISIANSSFVDAFFAAQKNRIQKNYRPWISTKMLLSAFWSRMTKGYFKLRVRY